ncbi:type II restriction endonuclease [Helicobacter sp. 13S00477-4]|uniref:type II restriction endonuclease n=1 Tax=Helicobacter sp. 13S00477-4 TaxID=1905759 RepID=UPI000BA5448C|nr:type II restriction endonuclease [Helicobacter sp. 13S00477-4]PAF52215.1 restriction endonuclease [Helicobacter sp. 13S00477-4]
MDKECFINEFLDFTKSLKSYVSDQCDNWSIKGFIDIHKNIFTISNDTKIVSKILEIHIFPVIEKFANSIDFDVVLADCQNYYPDISFVYRKNPKIKYAIDIKTTYRKTSDLCNGFTLGSHGEYFRNRTSKKNIQYPYGEYNGHFCLGIIYTRNNEVNEMSFSSIDNLDKITSVIKDIDCFFVEKWKIANDISGSGNTANIGSITKINDIMNGRGIFVKYGEEIFDDYWINYGKITITDKNGKIKKITKLKEFLEYRGIK